MAIDLRSGIAETARALNMDPVDLATIISFESGFNPDVWGGKGGQHYGLIQFGPTERQQYGVTVGDPSSQLGANGAIARYFWDRGWKPGMGMLDAYSIVNAGGPGLYNASDTKAGGTAGSVRDKVEQQMSGHRAKAEELIGQAAGPNTRRPYGPLEAAGGGDRPDRFTANPRGPVEAAGGGAGSDAGSDAPSAAANPYAALAAAAEPEKKNWWEVLGEGVSDAAGAMAKTPMPGYQISAQPGPARVDVGGGGMFDPARAEMQRQQLAAAMMRLNSGALWG